MSADVRPLVRLDATVLDGGGTVAREPAAHLPPMRRRVAFSSWGEAGCGQGDRAVPEEVPVAFRVNCTDYAVMLASPADLEDFAHGFLRSEGVIRRPSDIVHLQIVSRPEGLVVRVTLRDEHALRDDPSERRVAGMTGCGLCGVETLRQAIKHMPWLRDGSPISPAAVSQAVAALHDWQPHNAASGALHAAAFSDQEGRIRLSREDVGRHNALDKLIGALSRGACDPASGFVVMTSRCSFELVQKAARCGIRLLCTVSAPTALAVRLAQQANMSLITMARSGELLLLSGERRLTS